MKNYAQAFMVKDYKAKSPTNVDSRKSLPKRMEKKWKKISGWGSKEQKPNFAHLQFNCEDKKLQRFEKSFIGVVENVGMTYNIQEAFHFEGYFRVKITPLGANLCLMEESEKR